jgi:uncharacterized protein
MPDTDEVRSVEVVDNPAQGRYEVRVDGALAGFAAYRDEGDRLVFTHTEVDDAYEGQGLGGRLAAGALDDVRRRGLLVVPRCPFIRAWIERHPDYADLVA